ncbi:ABC transporter permease [Bacillus sp. B1-b2]|nr:ABC transporter permease [Bacillus sp. B1-b2]
MKYGGFRAENTTIYIPVVAPSTYLKVFYWDEQFDLANEYDSVSSVFTASTNGVYSFSSSIQFVPNFPVEHQVAARFIVNGQIETVALEHTGVTASNRSIIEISDILKLNAGDTVEVYFASSVPGVISSANNHFAAARFPSPT